jgi:hypothetical protein
MFWKKSKEKLTNDPPDPRKFLDPPWLSSKVICPWCHADNTDSGTVYAGGQYCCSACNKKFNLTRVVCFAITKAAS